MPVSTQCPGCSAPLKLKDELAGRNIKCPRCGNVFRVPGETTAIAPEPKPAPSKSPVEKEEDAPLLESANPLDFSGIGQDRDKDRDRNKGRDKDKDRDRDDDDDDDRPRSRKRSSRASRTEYVPCPKCEATGAERILWTVWGSFYGPALLSHVRCPECGHAYNGKTGGSNLIAAIIFITVPLLGIAAIVGTLLWYIFVYRYR